MIRSIHGKEDNHEKNTIQHIVAAMAIGFAGCVQQAEPSGNDNQQEQTQKQSPKKDGKVLIAYFSRVGNFQEEIT